MRARLAAVMLSVFHEPWWLDAAAPGSWDEAQVEEDGQPVARWPFLVRRRFGLRLLLAPPLSGRLGPLTCSSGGRNEARLRRFDHLVNELMDQLPPADLFRQSLHPDVLSWLPFYRRGFQIEPRTSYVIDHLTDIVEVWNGISGGTRRVIRNAAKTLEVEQDSTTDRLERMIRSTFDRQHLDVPYDSSVLDRIVSACLARDRGTVLSAVDSSGNVHASLFCAWDDQRAWYICGGGDPRLRSSGAGSLLMWELIKESAKHVDRFDFEGSMLPSVERYFRNFGGQQETYFLVTRTSKRFSPLWALWQRWARAPVSINVDGEQGVARRLLMRAARAAWRAGGRDGDD
jgi:Acetyltransferase (GNAT) domain